MAQVNPHFLYNTLNNIYVQAIDQHPDTPELIMRLSNLMRFITDEATQDFVPLADEIACIQDYIALQELRLEDNIKIDFSVTGDPDNLKIAPLILITYLENAFKYGISSHQKCVITIRLTVDQDQITFFCQNCIFERTKLSERSGIGLQNARQRLNHLYPGAHKLTISTENGLYTVNLILQPKILF